MRVGCVSPPPVRLDAGSLVAASARPQPAAVHPADHLRERGGWHALGHEPRRPGSQRAAEHAGAGVAGEDDAPRGRVLGGDALGDLGAVALGHLHVEQRDVRPLRAQGGQRLGAGGGFAEDLQVGLHAQQRRDRAADELLVLGGHEPDHRRAAPAAALAHAVLHGRPPEGASGHPMTSVLPAMTAVSGTGDAGHYRQRAAPASRDA